MNLKLYEERAEIKASWKTTKPLAEFCEPVCICSPPLQQLNICSWFWPVFISWHLLLGSVHESLSWLDTSEVVTHLCKGQAHRFSLGTLLGCPQEGSMSHGDVLILPTLEGKKREANLKKKKKKGVICLLERHWDSKTSVWGLIIMTPIYWGLPMLRTVCTWSHFMLKTSLWGMH